MYFQVFRVRCVLNFTMLFTLSKNQGTFHCHKLIYWEVGGVEARELRRSAKKYQVKFYKEKKEKKKKVD